MALTARMTRRSAIGRASGRRCSAPNSARSGHGARVLLRVAQGPDAGPAQTPDAPPPPLDNFLQNLTYDDYRNIYFRPEAARWSDTSLPFHVSSFHPGWLFKEPVHIHEVTEGTARPLTFSTDDFEYRNDVGTRVPDHAELSGIAGLKLTHR